MKKTLLLFCVSLFMLFSCTDPQTIGLEVQPESDKITLTSFDDNNPFTLQTKIVDSVRADERLRAILGYYESVDFLDAKASFSTHLRLTENSVDFGQNPKLDSAIISLAYSGYYGDTSIAMSIQVEQLSEDIYLDSNYYSNETVSSLPFSEPLEYTFLPRPNTLQYNSGDTIGQRSLFIKANQLGQLILDAGSDNLVDNESFISYLKGIKFLVDPNQSSSSLLYFNLIDGASKVTIYYNDSLSYDLIFSAAAARINHFEMEDNFMINDLFGVQSMAGLELHLTFNNLADLRKRLTNKAINQTLVSFDSQNSTDLNPSHSTLSLVRLDSNQNKLILDDFLEEGHFGGSLENDKYTFNISKYMLGLISGEYTDSTLVLVPTGESVNAFRTEINQNIKVNIIYTEF